MSQPTGPSLPTLGRIVLVCAPPVVVPAIVTAVTSSDGDIMCTMFPPDLPPRPSGIVEHDEGGRPGTWHWPRISR